MTKYIFVTGGVVSGLGKGITAASLGRLLKARGLKVAAQKLDPYINVDPGTMSPYQHGGRGRDRSGPRPLRALHRRGSKQILRPYHRQGLFKRYFKGTPRRIPRKDRSGHSAYHRRNQAFYLLRRQKDRRGRCYHRNRRHHRRHREPAVSGGYPSGRP